MSKKPSRAASRREEKPTKRGATPSKSSGGFIPEDAMSGGDGKFLNIKDEAENTIRIISKPVIGWVNWEEDEDEKRIPKRYPIDEEPEATDEENKPRKFIAVVCVDRMDDDKIKVCEITQQGIIKQLSALADNPKWGQPFSYDIAITRKGEGKKSRYTVTPEPKSPLPKNVIKDINKCEVCLENYFLGDDARSPWDFQEGDDATELFTK